ncbi:MAG: Protein-tyrosine-phosphatase [Pseudonocardiales bacterium]|nr:Protein-tyrosine-phosphatase [Pseudonocardiales bacterium]
MPAPLEGVWNLRDLGGLAVRSGGQTRTGRLFRSGTLWFATMQDCAILAGFEFDTVIDLRMPQEELREEDWLCELLDLRYHHLPVAVPSDGATNGTSGTGTASGVALLHPAGSGAQYLRLLESNAAPLIRALKIIGDPDNHPLLFHCAAGKDPTGVLAAVVLACLDVEESSIIADYAESDVGIRPIAERYREHPLYGPSAAAAIRHRVDGAAIAEFLRLAGGAAGVREWALRNGLGAVPLERMRAELVVD